MGRKPRPGIWTLMYFRNRRPDRNLGEWISFGDPIIHTLPFFVYEMRQGVVYRLAFDGVWTPSRRACTTVEDTLDEIISEGFDLYSISTNDVQTVVDAFNSTRHYQQTPVVQRRMIDAFLEGANN